MRKAKSLARLCVCASSSEHSLLVDVISTKLSCAGPIMFVRYSETFMTSLGDVSFKTLTHWIGGNRKRS